MSDAIGYRCKIDWLGGYCKDISKQCPTNKAYQKCPHYVSGKHYDDGRLVRIHGLPKGSRIIVHPTKGNGRKRKMDIVARDGND